MYDYVIVGAGPTGLTLAFYLYQTFHISKYGFKKIILIDREKSIGGCHRVRRISGIFTEHGPRIYSSAYVNTKQWLSDMGMNFSDYFVPYNFSISSIGGQSIFDMKLKELFWFELEFIRLFIDSTFSKSISCLDFMHKHNFSEKTIDFIDRICRLTDGAGSERYTLFELLQLINQNSLYRTLQPNKQTDTGLFIDIKKNIPVNYLLGTYVKGLLDKNTLETNRGQIKGKNIIFAVPPHNLVSILSNSFNKNIFGSYNEMVKWSHRNSYNTYISVMFYWKYLSDLPKIWGFPISDWGIAFIVLTDYMQFDDYDVVISCCITKPDSKSSVINKTIHQCSERELAEETFRQLKTVFSKFNFPDPDVRIVSPGDYKEGNKWVTKDTAYMKTVDAVNMDNIKFQSIYENIYTCGPHNEKGLYHFTSMECAVTNAMQLYNEMGWNKSLWVKHPIELIDIISIVMTLLLIFLFIWLKPKFI